MTRASGRTSTGASSATPKIITIMPSPSSAAAAEPPAPPNRPASSEASPRPMTANETSSRLRLTRRAPGVTASRIASTGSTCVARRAGIRPETSVAIMPTSRPTITVRAAITVPVEGSSIPNDASSERSAGASTTPARIPATEARKPITSVSAITELSTWRRDAPSVRSSANSRERCATVTANVLKIRKPPTSTATPANTSRPILRKPSESVMSDADSSACSLPVRTTAEPPSEATIAALSSSGLVPPSAAATTSVTAPGSSAIFCTSASGMFMLWMPIDFWSPTFVMPEIS